MTFHPKKGDHVIITSRYAVKDGVLLGGQRGRCVGSVYLNSGLWMYEIRLDAVGVTYGINTLRCRVLLWRRCSVLCAADQRATKPHDGTREYAETGCGQNEDRRGRRRSAPFGG